MKTGGSTTLQEGSAKKLAWSLNECFLVKPNLIKMLVKKKKWNSLVDIFRLQNLSVPKLT